MTTFAINDRIYVDDAAIPERFHGAYTIEKVNPKNLNSRSENTGKLLAIPRAYAKPLPADASPEPPTATAVLIDYVPPVVFHVGQVVTIKGAGWRLAEDIRFVVIGEARRSEVPAYKVAKLGGDEGRFFPKVPSAYLTAVLP